MAPFGASRAGLMSVAGDDIPDSVVYQLKTPISGLSDGDTVNTWPAVEGKPDATSSSLIYSENEFNEIDAVSGDGIDDILNCGSDSTDIIGGTEFTWAMTIQTQDTDRIIMGFEDENIDSFCRIDFRDDGDIQLRMRDDTTNITTLVADSPGIRDGNPYSIVWVRGDDDGGDNWELYIGQQGQTIGQEPLSVDSDGFDLGEFTSPADDPDDFTLFARNKDDFHGDMFISQFELANDAWSETEIDDFHERVL